MNGGRTMTKLSCCICGAPIMEGIGNNPEPIIRGTDFESARCCDFCNEHYVVPIRFRRLQNGQAPYEFGRILSLGEK